MCPLCPPGSATAEIMDLVMLSSANNVDNRIVEEKISSVSWNTVMMDQQNQISDMHIISINILQTSTPSGNHIVVYTRVANLGNFSSMRFFMRDYYSTHFQTNYILQYFS